MPGFQASRLPGFQASRLCHSGCLARFTAFSRNNHALAIFAGADLTTRVDAFSAGFKRVLALLVLAGLALPGAVQAQGNTKTWPPIATSSGVVEITLRGKHAEDANIIPVQRTPTGGKVDKDTQTDYHVLIPHQFEHGETAEDRAYSFTVKHTRNQEDEWQFDLDPEGDAIESNWGVSDQAFPLVVLFDVPKIVWQRNQNVAQEDFVSAEDLSSEGAFVLLNDDDDNYSGTPDKDDVDENGELRPIEGPNGELAETDLLPLILRKSRASNPGDGVGFYVLNFPEQVRIWRKPNRTERILPRDSSQDTDFQIPADKDTVLYIEGVELGTAEIEMDYHFGGREFRNAAKLKVNIFDLQGPTSVLRGTTYRYHVLGESNNGMGGSWATPVWGSISERGENDEFIEIGWNTGNTTAQTGAVVYAPSGNFSWGREVDLVALQLANHAEALENKIHLSFPEQGYSNVRIGWNGAAAEDGEPGSIHAAVFGGYLAIKSLKGPSRGGVTNRGVDRLEYGFIQRSRWSEKRSIYRSTGCERTSSLEGMDLAFDWFERNLAPWIEDENYTEPLEGEDENQEEHKGPPIPRQSLLRPDTNESIEDGSFVFHYEFRRGNVTGNALDKQKFVRRSGITFTDDYQSDENVMFRLLLENWLYLAVRTKSGDQSTDDRFFVVADTENFPWTLRAYGENVFADAFPAEGKLRPVQGEIDGVTHEWFWGAYCQALTFQLRGEDTLGELPGTERDLVLEENPILLQEYPPEQPHENWND